MAIEDGLHPQFPVVSGDVPLTHLWQLSLPQPCNRRVEDGSLVLWRPRFTVWLSAYGSEDGMGIAERLERDRRQAAPVAYDFREGEAAGVSRLRYRLDEDGRMALYAFAHAEDGQIMAAIYFAEAAQLAEAEAIADSLRLR